MDTFSKKSEYKYSCAKCMYNTNNICNYNKHLLTPKHKNTDNSGKSEHKYSCSCCHYNASDKYDYNKHLLTQKHITNYTFYTNNNTLSEKSEYTYSCSCCKYHTNILCNYNKHLLTAKHLQQATKESLPDSQPQQESDSQKPEPNWPEIIQVLLKENQEKLNFMVTQHNTIVEQNKTLTELVKNQQPTIATNNSHNNNNNQNYNINMFLSDKCKDAQNLSEFIHFIAPMNAATPSMFIMMMPGKKTITSKIPRQPLVMSVKSIYNSVSTGLRIPRKMKMTAITMLHIRYTYIKKPSNPVMTNMSIKSSKTSAKKYPSTNKSSVMLCYRIDFVGFAIKNRLLSGLFFVLPL